MSLSSDCSLQIFFGTMKNMAVTVGQLEKALDNRCMFDVSSLEGVTDEEESDMYLYPDLSTFESFHGDHSREKLQD